jgi:phage FluMu protein gp41
MAEAKFKLSVGYKVGKDTLYDVVLSDLTTGDIIQSQLESEKLVTTEKGAELVTSPTLAGANMLRRQIVSIGDVKGPLSLDELQRLHLDDFELIQYKAQELDQAQARRMGQENAARGRTDQGSTGN